MKNLYAKLGFIVAVVALFIFFAVPVKEKIKLGLDLKGGMHLVLKVQTDDAIKIVTDQAVLQMEEEMKKAGVKYDRVDRSGYDKVVVNNYDLEKERDMETIVKENFSDWTSSSSNGKYVLTIKSNVALQIRDQAVEQAKETIRNRIDQFGVSEPVIQRQGIGGNSDSLLVQLPGVEDPQRVKNLIRNTAVLELKLVQDGPVGTKEALLSKYNNVIPEGTEIVRGSAGREEQGFYLVKKVSAITGADLKDASVGKDEYGSPAVNFRLKSEGSRKFYKVTSENQGQRLAIILDGIVESAPSINAAISDSGIIQGHFTYDQAKDLSLTLRSGSLPASILYMEERTIGPSLGADSIRTGLRAMVAALLLVIIFMLVYYKVSGLNAVVALILNTIITMGALAYFRATLTLPGIAGLILSIGMAVDANVLIFERIREDLRAGKSVKSAIDEGFKKAFVTIFDSNLTTVISAIFLFQFGSGPIKGFAVTLIIGIAASMFTACYVSKVIFELDMSLRKKVNTLSI